MIVKPTNALTSAHAWAAVRAPMADFAPMRFPMRLEATTPGFRLFSSIRPDSLSAKTYQSQMVS